VTTIITGIAGDIPAALFTVREAGSLVSIGTLLAFVIVSVGVLALASASPTCRGPFQDAVGLGRGAPGRHFRAGADVRVARPHLGRLLIWLAIRIVIYFTYGIRKSKWPRGLTRA